MNLGNVHSRDFIAKGPARYGINPPLRKALDRVMTEALKQVTNLWPELSQEAREGAALAVIRTYFEGEHDRS